MRFCSEILRRSALSLISESLTERTCAARISGVSGASVRAQARNTVGAEVGQKVVVESSTKRLLGVMILVYLLPILCFFVGYFATGALASEGLRYAIAIAAFLIGIIPAVVCDRHMKSTGALTFTIVRLF